jgi:chromosomal replication initiation ATPase DnaA
MEAIKLPAPALTPIQGGNYNLLKGTLAAVRKARERLQIKHDDLEQENKDLRHELKQAATELATLKARLEIIERDRAILNIEQVFRIETNEIISLVCAYRNTSFEELLIPNRTRSLAYTRALCFYLCSQYETDTLKGLGRLFKRNHATVIHGRDMIHDQISLYDDVMCDVAYLMGQIKRLSKPTSEQKVKECDATEDEQSTKS